MRRTALLTVALALLLAAPAAAADPLGLSCADQEGLRFCSGKVATFDGIPLDVNVTLPPGAGARPLMVLSHGYGGEKYPLVAQREGRADPADVSGGSLPWARRGYAVLSITARGFNGSCGKSAETSLAGCQTGWIKLDDTRYEVRDVQELAGRLVDEGHVDPVRIAAHGGSYGGGVSLALALLRDRVMLPDGSYAPWRSPKGTPLRLAAAAPYIPWSDLVYSLVPNGRFLDYALPPRDESRRPYGVVKTSFVSALYGLGQATGNYAPPGVDPGADLNRWFPEINAGEPYEGNPFIAELANEIYEHHSSVAIDRSVAPAPTFIANGWTDDLFPVDEALRIDTLLRAEHPEVPFAQMHFDFGHMRGQNKRADLERYWGRVTAWVDRHAKGDASAPAVPPAEVLTQTCPAAAPSGGPFTAASWRELRPGEVRFASAAPQTLTSAGGDPDVARRIDPIAGEGACARVAATPEPGTAEYRLPPAAGDGFTLVGAPTVIATLAATGAFPQVDARLWDVAPDGQQTLVARTVYRPDPTGRQVFQLHPGGYRFAPGHVARLQLLGRDAPYARASNGTFQVAVSDLELRLPVVDRPGAAGGAVRPPLAPVLPPGRRLAPGHAGPPQAARRPDATPTSSGPGAGAVAPRRACRPSVLERATARPSGRGLRFTLPRGAGRVTVTVRRGDRVVARFTRSRSFTWSGRGRGRAVRDGVHTVRFAAGRRGSDVAVARRGGRFRARPDFALAPLCGTVALLRVDPVVGRTARVTFRLGRRGDAVVSAGDGRRVLRGVAAGRTVRIRVAVRRGARGGSVPVTLRVTAGGRTVTRRVVALRR